MPQTRPACAEFRRQSVGLLLGSGRSLKTIAEKLGVSSNSLGTWGETSLWEPGTAAAEADCSFAELCERNLKTARAWSYKETFIEFWTQGRAEQGDRFFKQQYARPNLEKK